MTKGTCLRGGHKLCIRLQAPSSSVHVLDIVEMQGVTGAEIEWPELKSLFITIATKKSNFRFFPSLLREEIAGKKNF